MLIYTLRLYLKIVGADDASVLAVRGRGLGLPRLAAKLALHRFVGCNNGDAEKPLLAPAITYQKKKSRSGLQSPCALRRELRKPNSKRLIYHAFDLLYLNGSDLRPAALIDRKRALRELPATPLFLSFCCSQPGS